MHGQEATRGGPDAGGWGVAEKVRFGPAAAVQPHEADVSGGCDGENAVRDLERVVAETLGLSEKQLSAPHNPNHGTRSEFSYRMAWTRTRLKNKKLIERVGPKLWELARP